MHSAPETFAITLKLTPAQYQWIENTAQFLATETGCEVSHSSIMMRLMEIGLPQFELELQALRASVNAKGKRFPKLQLVLSE